MVLPELSRRSFLAGLAATGVVVACSGDDSSSSSEAADAEVPELDGNPFQLGVASGDPTDTSVILWTRLVTDPAAADGGIPAEEAPVGWAIATDESFDDVVMEGAVTTGPEVGHSVHVDAQDLDPDSTYWYRFTIGEQTSPVGRTRTMPASGSAPDAFVVGQVSCQRWDQGEWAAYADLAEDDVDLVVHCGDYIYERPVDVEDRVRQGIDDPAITLEDYRLVHALYKTDPALQAAHATAPWLITWDDHEVSNNYVADTPSEDSESESVEELLERRAAGYQAWWEHTPTRVDPPEGPDLPIHRAVVVGDLARFHVLDTRQYRTVLDCESVSSIGPRCDTSLDPATTVLGEEQEAWVAEGVAEPGPVWDVLVQQIVLHQWRFGDADNTGWNLDQWDGYPEARGRLLDALAGAAGQPVVLTGDVHSSWVAELREDFDDPASTTIGTEFVVPGVSSTPSGALTSVAPLLRDNNDHIVYDDQVSTGWLRHEITPDGWTAQYRYVEVPDDPDSPVVDGGSFELGPDGVLAET
ncbi:MAG: alkaline phosphatase D family protein [Actinomycetota bacterium]